MFTLTVCDHIMIAHSFRGEEFGPAQKLHGATFAVEAEFRADQLGHLQILVDIGLAKVELRRVLLSKRDQFAGTVTEKLLTYALGRGIEYYDMPAVRSIVRASASNDYRFSSLILGIVRSAPFQMRRTEIAETPAVRQQVARK